MTQSDDSTEGSQHCPECGGAVSLVEGHIVKGYSCDECGWWESERTVEVK